MKFPLRTALVFLAPGFAAVAHAQKATETAPPGVSVKRNLVYAQRGKRALHILLARPQPLPKKPIPIIIYLHGGAWRQGSHLKLPSGAWNLARNGFAVASVEFRGSDAAIFPAPLDDCRAAVAYLKQNAKNHSLDARRMGVYGVSTGGHLAALLALTGSSVKAAAIESAPTDLATLSAGASLNWNAATSPLSQLLGGSVSAKRELAERASPLFYADEWAPPLLILHGDADTFVPVAQSEKLYQTLKAAGAPVDYQIYSGQAHGLKNAREAADARVLKFFREKL